MASGPIKRNPLIALLLLSLMTAPAFAAAGSLDAQITSRTASEQVDAFHDALLASARLDDDFDARIALLGSEFDQVFDLPRIARISIGATWRQLDGEAKAEYLKALRLAVLSTYVVRFDEDRGQQLKVLEAREVKPGRDLVRAEITRPTGERVALDYYLRNGRVFNIEADGVSDLSLRRTGYSSLVKADGFDALLTHLRDQFSIARSKFAALHD